jgi:hypothetical protein
VLLGAKARSLLGELRNQQALDPSIKPDHPTRLKIDLRELLIDDRGTSLATFASQGHRNMCVVSADVAAADATKACSKEPDAAIIRVSLTGKCTPSGFGAIPSIIAGGLSTLARICAAVRRKGVLFVDSQGNCVTP